MDRKSLHDFTLTARELLVTEASEVLESLYGLNQKGTFEAIARLPAVQEIEFARETRERLESFFTDEVAAGLTPKEAYAKLTKEIAFTWLNRLVAFRMMESRGLIRQTLAKGTDSNGFLRWLARPKNKECLTLYEQGDLPKNAFGEGPRERAYRQFLLWQCGAVSTEIRVLFDTDTIASCFFPRPRVLHEIIRMLNVPELDEAWQEGSEETIGWVYQYFIEQEKAEVFDRLYKKKQKIRAQDIPAATQLFTPRWIVKYLVQNTLGRQWVQMHPDTRLVEQLDYLVPLEGEIPPVDLKPVKEVTLLDPACGTMHFGLVAFDLFHAMYKEEIERAGEGGWPAEPSVASEAEIPAVIIANNIYGIDIDLRAVQLSALTLFLKAKSYNRQAVITDSNLACADILPLNGVHLETFLSKGNLDPVHERILRALYPQLKLANQLGSLIKIEQEVQQLIDEERRRFEKEGRQMDLSGQSVTRYGERAFDEAFWKEMEDEIQRALLRFAEREADNGFFVGEAVKGVRLLDLLRRRYSIVVTNPPYSGQRNVNELLKESLQRLYPNKSGDLYSAFISRSNELTQENGRFGLITIHSFMFTSSYYDLRKELLENSAIETGCHLGTKSEFELSNPNAQGFVAFISRKSSERAYCLANIGKWYRLVNVKGAEKGILFEKLVKNENNSVYCCTQENFFAIPRLPLVYWITSPLRNIFKNNPSVEDIAVLRQGLKTADNFRFMRFWWETGRLNIAFNCRDCLETLEISKKWFPLMKGGPNRKWYGNQDHCINYWHNGFEIKAWGDSLYNNSGWSRIITSTDYYFREGLTYSAVSSIGLSVRLMPQGFIFDHAGNCIFSKDDDDAPDLMGLLNSSFVKNAIQVLNSTIYCAVGDILNIPIPTQRSVSLKSLVTNAVKIAMEDSNENEQTFDFIAPPRGENLKSASEIIVYRYHHLSEIEKQIDDEVYRLFGISDNERFAIDFEVENLNATSFPTLEDLAARWISYATGIVMGRFSPGIEGELGSAIVGGNHLFSLEAETTLRSLAVPHTIAVLDTGHPLDLARLVTEALTLMLGETTTAEVIKAIGGNAQEPEDALRSYLEKDFFKTHLQWYRKRPIYWLFQSPKKYYSVYLFHERITPDTLYLLKGNRYLGGKINATQQRIKEVRAAMQGTEGRERKRLEKELDQLETILADLHAFDRNIQQVLDAKNERGEVVGWCPELDDGVILNLAPLRELMPSWKIEPAKFWKELEEGEYDWSYTAMRYWPDRVLEKCKTNKSFAIAHDRLDIYEGE